MDNEKFLRELNRDLVDAKNELKSQSENIIKELNDMDQKFYDEMDREKNKVKNPIFNNHEGDELFAELVQRDADYGAMLDFGEMDDEGYDVVMSLAKNDPTFALSFLERRRTEIPEEKFIEMKNELLGKMNIK